VHGHCIERLSEAAMKTKRITKWVLGLLPLIGSLMLCGLAYWTWCWGWWGQNRYLRYFLQCNCPAASEEARYPEEVDVLVSACEDPDLSPFGQLASPSGRYTIFSKRGEQDVLYLYDRDTDSVTVMPPRSINAFLDEDLLVQNELDRSYALYNLAGQKLMPLNTVYISRDALVPEPVLDILRRSAKIYLVFIVVALAPDYQNHPDANYAFTWESKTISSLPAYTIAEILQKNNIPFEWIKPRRETPLIPIDEEYFVGSRNSPLIAIVRVPQPLLRQRQPLESYAPDIRVQVEARRQEEQWNRLGANTVAVAGLLIAVGLMGTRVFFALRTRVRNS
jgi:hypothetical protein